MMRLIRKRETLLFAIIVVMIAVFSTRAADFSTPDNLAGIFNDTAILIILALAQMTVILTKSIDLSVAANLAFTGMAIAMMNATFPGLPLIVLILAAVVIGAALGSINGFLVWR
ncbi:ribose/xylose/arabinose/galactoside ABC-type transport system permease subunit, partial [Rhizobium viscosum]|nr:ribose/xylose/arabinose/galactoside ABC-type transport system permease subunit [Rhizobium viscosum]